MVETTRIEVTVNGAIHIREVEPRMTIADFLRDVLGLTGTHIGCEHGVCGACTVLLDGMSVRSCILYIPQANGCDILTIEGITSDVADRMHPIQEAFRDCHALQCGFCTPGMVLTIFEFLSEVEDPSEAEIRRALAGNLCRCTGYEPIVAAIRQAAGVWQRVVQADPDEVL